MVIEILEKIIKKGFINIGYNENITIKKSNKPELCDYQCDDIFKCAKLMHKNPIELGEEIVNYINSLEDFNKYFDSVTFCNPGFINIKLSSEFINNMLIKMNDNPKFNIKMPEKKEIYFIDYGGYNIAKPLHIGHLRPSIIGESIKRIIEYVGHNTISDVHLGDYGLQMGQVIYGIQRDKLEIKDINIDYLNKIYPEISALCKENKEVQEICATITKELQEGNNEYKLIWDKILEVSLEDVKELCNYLSVSFDLWEGESDSYKYLEDTEKILKEKNLLNLSEGALVVNVKRDDDNKPMPPMMFKKSNGAYVYDSTDLATIYERKNKYNPDHILYVTDFRQNLHFEQVFRASSLAGIMSYDKFEHNYNGTINGTDGKPFKTRKGDAPKLRELFDLVKETFLSMKESNKDMSDSDINIIVNAIIKYADLQNARDRDYIFDIPKFSNVVGKTGPYLLYTYLRLNKIIESEKSSDKLCNIIYNDVDRNLRLKMLELDNVINKAFEERMPNYIADYIYDLAVLANTFYQNNHISNCDDEIKKNDWLYVINLTNKILKEMLQLIIIDIPTVM